MKTRSSRVESSSQGEGRLFKKLWISPRQNGHERRQSVQQRNNQAVLSDHQSPVSSRKLQSHAKSQIGNLKQNCITLHDALSPIIGSRRRALRLRNVCRDLGSVRQGSKKENIVPLKIDDSNQKDKISPLQENVNINTSKKDKGMTENIKKQTAVRERSVVSDKENYLAACMTQTPLRQSKRIRVANRNKDTQNAPKKARKDPSNRELTETKLLSDANSLPKERTLRRAGRKELDPQRRSQETTITKNLKNRTAAVQASNITRSRSKENVNSLFDKACVAAEQEAGVDEQELGPQTRCQKTSSLKNLKSQTAAVQACGITRSRSKENSNITFDKAYIAAEQEAGSGKKELGPKARLQKTTSTKNLRNRTPTVQASNVSRSGSKWNPVITCDKAHTTVEQEGSSDENKVSPKAVKDTTVLSRRTSRRSVGKEDNAGKGDETPKRSGTFGKVKAETATPVQVESNVKKLSNSLKSKGKAQTRPKPPVWASVRGIKITPGKRKSLRISSDAYEFTSSPSKEHKEAKKKRITKPRKLLKKIKPCTKLTLLTTDPSWQDATFKGMPLLTASLASSTSKVTTSQSCLENSVGDTGEETSIPSNISSIRDEDATDEDFSSEANFNCFENSDGFHGFEGETRSSFIIPSKDCNRLVPLDSTSVLPTPAASNYKSKFTGNSFTPQMEDAIRAEAPERESVPMTSANVLPTPVISKHITKFIGGSSTPRVENTLGSTPNQEAETLNDSIAQCFGFNDEPEEESELNISPVQRSRQQSRLRHTLEITGTSDVTDGELHPASLPSRFSWGSLRPGNQSRASSTSRSSSMVAQGRSVSLMTDTLSHTSQPTISSFIVPTVDNHHLKPQRKKIGHLHREKGSVSIGTESRNKQKKIDVSVLFDENELVEKEPSGGQEVTEVSQPDSTLPPLKPSAESTANSPEKHFPKASRKSYSRTSLLNARRKFIEMHGGCADSDSDTEKEEESDMEFKPKPRKKSKKASKKSKKPAKETEQSSKKVSTSTSKKKNPANDDPLLMEWVSRLNSHFSEVEESILVVE